MASTWLLVLRNAATTQGEDGRPPGEGEGGGNDGFAREHAAEPARDLDDFCGPGGGWLGGAPIHRGPGAEPAAAGLPRPRSASLGQPKTPGLVENDEGEQRKYYCCLLRKQRGHENEHGKPGPALPKSHQRQDDEQGGEQVGTGGEPIRGLEVLGRQQHERAGGVSHGDWTGERPEQRRHGGRHRQMEGQPQDGKGQRAPRPPGREPTKPASETVGSTRRRGHRKRRPPADCGAGARRPRTDGRHR